MRLLKTGKFAFLTAAILVLIFGSLHSAHADATITVVNLDSPGEGFNDPAAPDPDSTDGGNTGGTLGEQRLIAFQYAVDIWGAILDSSIEIRVGANFDPLTCGPTSAVLGSAGPRTAHRNFPGAPESNTWYTQALANSLAGSDQALEDDIGATFNSAIGTTCSFPNVWYYGLDEDPPGNKIDFVNVVLHELAHGLGFLTFVSLSSGAKFFGFDDAFMLYLEDHSTGKSYPDMTDAERVTASNDTGDLHWIGPNVVTAGAILSSGRHPSGHIEMYAPASQQPGSSVSHFSTTLFPDQLMEPSYTGPTHDVGLTLSLMEDIGWVQTEEDIINFNDFTVDSYGGTQDKTGDVTIENGGTTLRLVGNRWQQIEFNYTITPDTVVEFDFQSSAQGEIHGIGFDTDLSISSDRTFKLYGTQNWGTQDFNNYPGGGGIRHYRIPVGNYYTGFMPYLFFTMDHDVTNPTGESVFSNITVYEDPGSNPNPSINFNDFSLGGYGGTQDTTGDVNIESGGTTLRLVGNRWQQIEFNYTITPDTVVEFNFQSSAQGEIHGIGFDTDLSISSDRTFKLYGTQNWGTQDFNNYPGGGGIRHYRIPVGAYYTGFMPYLFFTMDHDVTDPTGESVFSNITVYEDPGSNPNPPISFNDFSLGGYGGTQDTTGDVNIESGGTTLRLVGNRWQQIEFNYTITPDTVVEFNFQSSAQGEIHGIGFDTDLSISSDRTFKLYGTQNWGTQDFNNYPGGGGIRHYRIPVGNYYTGFMPYLFFTMDHDVTDPTGQSVFSLIKVYEDTN